MLTSLIVAAVLTPSTGRVASASLFKNGYAVVVREYPVSGSEAFIEEMPQATLGTLWVSASPGIQITELVRTTQPTTEQRDATSMEDILRANTGRELTFGLAVEEQFAATKTITGKLLTVGAEIVVLQAEGRRIAFYKSNIRSINSSGELVYSISNSGSKNVLDIKFKNPAKGSIYLVGLEKGLTWAPSYAIDLGDPKKLSLTAKATVLDDLASLNDIELKFVTGFPNVPWLSYLDPLLSGTSVDQFVGMLSAIGQNSGGGGNFAMQNMAPREHLGLDLGTAFAPNLTPGMQAEDLFFYRQPHVSLKNGDRGYFVMFQTQSDYSHLYTLDLPNTIENNVEYRPIPQTPPDVWHTIRFKNTSAQPLTTAPVTVFQNGEVMGQDTLSYASPGSEVLVRMSKALDVHADASEEELSRDRASLKLPNGNYFDLVTLKGTLALQNFKDKAVKMKITKDLAGELVSAQGAISTKTAKGLQQINPTLHLEWNPDLAPGAKQVLTYTYKVYVRTP